MSATALSHPSRVRGLKPTAQPTIKLAATSHPSRVRGLKHRAGVAGLAVPIVAPLAGAWIETKHCIDRLDHRESHPSRVRGLKHPCVRGLSLGRHVAPLAGAWIETTRQRT